MDDIQRKARLCELLLDQVKDLAIFILDPEGRVLTWGLGARSLFGYEAKEIIGEPFARLFVPEDVRSAVPQAELRTAAADGCASDDRWLLRKNGTRFWATGSTFRLMDGELQGFGKFVRDQTDTKQAEQKINRLNEELFEKVHELQRFEEVVVGRELKMIDLQKEINHLKQELTGQKERLA